MRHWPHSQFLLYLLVGGSTALAYILICSMLTAADLRPGNASVIGYALVIIPTYWGQKSLTFCSPTWHRVEFSKYVALQVAGNIACFLLSENLAAMGLPPWQLFGAVAVIVAGAYFLAMKYRTTCAHA